MRQMSVTKTACLLAAGLATSAAQAQLIVGFDDTAAGVTTAYEIRVSDGSNTATPLFDGIDVWGLASDNVNNVLWISSGSELLRWDGTGSPVSQGSITSATTGGVISVVSLAFDNGVLYATRNIGGDGTATPEGLYSIDTNTMQASVVVDYTAASYDFGGFDADSGRFFGTNDDATPFGTGLFEIELNGTITKLADYPATVVGTNDVDGLAVGGGKAYLVEDQPGETIHVFNFSTNSYEGTITSPFATSEIFSAGAWAPWLGGGSACVGDIADDFGTLGADGQVSFGDFLALLGLIGPCPGGNPGCTGDIADDFGTLGADGQVSFGDFLALLGVIGPCP